jgi:hypothetical protein
MAVQRFFILFRSNVCSTVTYLAVNTLRHHYKDQPFDTVPVLYFQCDKYTNMRICLAEKWTVLYMITAATHSNQLTWKCWRSVCVCVVCVSEFLCHLVTANKLSRLFGARSRFICRTSPAEVVAWCVTANVSGFKSYEIRKQSVCCNDLWLATVPVPPHGLSLHSH